MTGTVTRSTPYAWPYDGQLDPSRLALLVIGEAAPRDGGTCAPDPALGRIGDLAGSVLEAGGVVVEVSTTRPPKGVGAPSPAPSPAGSVAGSVRIAAGGIDGFYSSTLDQTLRALGRDQLLLAGGWLETGVHSTMRSANDRGYECLLVLDACIAYDPGLVAAARSQIEMSGGIFGAVGETDHVLDAIAAAGVADERTSA